MSSLKKDPGAFGPLIEYMERARQREEDEPAQKKQRVDADMCKICYMNDINTCLVPCGHVVACLSCAERLGDEPCPIRKQAVAFVQKTYRA